MLDLIQSLTSELSTTPEQAKLIAGRLLAHAEEELRRQFGPSTAEDFASRLPNRQEWRTASLATVAPEAIDERAAIGVNATLVEVLGHVGIDPLKAGIALPVVSAFLRSRLPPELLRNVLQVAPLLAMAAPEKHYAEWSPEIWEQERL